MLDECCLNGVQVLGIAEPLDSGDLAINGIERKGRAGIYRHAVEHDGTRGTRSTIADDLGAGQVQLVTQGLG